MSPVRTYGQYCPIAKGAEILGDRWTLLIVRELLAGASHFNELQRGLPGISKALLAGRLRTLARAGVIERRTSPNGRGTEYVPTPAGRDLQEVVDAVGDWGGRWAIGEPTRNELDPVVLMTFISRHMHADRLPGRRVVVQFDLRGPRRGRYWLVLEREEVSLCLKDPGFDADLLLKADVKELYRVYMGRVTMRTAIADESIVLDGPSGLKGAFPSWFEGSHFQGAVRTGMRAGRGTR